VRYESEGTWFAEAAGREMMRSVDRWMRAPVVWFGPVASPGPFEFKTRRINQMECTVSIKADDTTTITTPKGRRVTLARAAQAVDDGHHEAWLAETRLCRINELTGLVDVHRRERDDARREARQAKAEAEESAKAAERARAEASDLLGRVGLVATRVRSACAHRRAHGGAAQCQGVGVVSDRDWRG
jgi:hypothetical protein